MINPVSTFTLVTLMTAASVNIDGTIGEAEDAVVHFFEYINTTQYNGTHFVLNLVFLMICFIIRFTMYIKNVDIETSTKEGKVLLRKYKSYVTAHLSLCYIFAFLVSYLLIKLANSEEIVVIWNIIVAPLIGFLSSIWFDTEFLLKHESKYKLLRNPLDDSEDDDNSDKKSSDHHNEINININNGEAGTDDKFVLQEDGTLSDSKKIEATINRIIDVQKQQSIILERHTKELKDQNHMLKNMQTLMKNNIKFELEDMIYTVLTRGYVTPAEDKKIRIKYNDYQNNDGNGDLKDLYESRYLDLEVREHPENRNS